MFLNIHIIIDKLISSIFIYLLILTTLTSHAQSKKTSLDFSGYWRAVHMLSIMVVYMPNDS